MRRFLIALFLPYILMMLFIVVIAAPLLLFIMPSTEENKIGVAPVSPTAFSANGKLLYRTIDYNKIMQYLQQINSKMCDELCLWRIRTIDDKAKQNNVDPLLLFAVIGAEHSLFRNNLNQIKARLDNPFNVGCLESTSGGPWCKMSLDESAGKAAFLLREKISVDISELYNPNNSYSQFDWRRVVDFFFNSKRYRFKSECANEKDNIKDIFDWINSYCNQGGAGIYAADRNWSNNVRYWFTELEKQNLYADDGAYIWPTLGGCITSGFGPRNNEFHHGVDVSGNKATFGWAVFAAHDGIVKHAGPGANEGNYIELEGQYKTTFYMHLAGFTVSKGNVIHRGDLIGYIGSTGRSTGPHLHFQVEEEGKVVDPLGLKYYTKIPEYCF